MNKNFIKITVIVCLIISTLQWAPKRAHAIWGFGDTNVIVGDVSVSGLSNWASNIATKLKTFVLDKMAVVIAKAILHKLTLAVIDWINNGYEGNPAFLTNPGDFFSDVADQVTGAFIDETGPLSKLCSPFNNNVRRGLVLKGYAPADLPDYACTLDTIINNPNTLSNIVTNSTDKNSVGSQLAGTAVGRGVKTVDGFFGGDFSQGGWPAFIAISTEPQNNPGGAYLMAKSELQARVANRNTAVKRDLMEGGGFLSYPKCTDAPVESLGQVNEAQANQLAKLGDQTLVTGRDKFGETSSIQKKVDKKTGIVKYQNCQNQTPGSAVASKLFANINSPELELAFAQDMNAVISAAITQLVNSFMQKGLYALSGKGSGSGGQSYTQQALQEITNKTNADLVNGQNEANRQASSPTNQAVQNNKASYDQAVNLLTASKNALLAAAACFDSKASQGSTSFATTQATAIRNLIAINKIDPLIASMASKQQAANAQVAQLTQVNTTTQTTITSLDDLQNQSVIYDNTIKQSTITAGQVDTATAGKDLSDAQSIAKQGSDAATQYQASCDAYPGQQIPVYITP